MRDRIPAYVSGPFMKPGDNPYRDFEADIAGYLDTGFRAIKLRMGSNPAQDGATAVAGMTLRSRTYPPASQHFAYLAERAKSQIRWELEKLIFR